MLDSRKDLEGEIAKRYGKIEEFKPTKKPGVPVLDMTSGFQRDIDQHDLAIKGLARRAKGEAPELLPKVEELKALLKAKINKAKEIVGADKIKDPLPNVKPAEIAVEEKKLDFSGQIMVIEDTVERCIKLLNTFLSNEKDRGAKGNKQKQEIAETLMGTLAEQFIIINKHAKSTDEDKQIAVHKIRKAYTDAEADLLVKFGNKEKLPPMPEDAPEKKGFIDRMRESKSKGPESVKHPIWVLKAGLDKMIKTIPDPRKKDKEALTPRKGGKKELE